MEAFNELFSLTDSVAVVTGAGSGLGVVFAEALASAGASVACVGRRIEMVEETANSIRANGGRATAIQGDVTNQESVRRFFRIARERYGAVHILVNNAGIASVGAPEALGLEDWQRVIDTNLTGVFLCAQEAAKIMIEQGHGGRIINVASILGACASEPIAAASYAASKGGVINLTRDLAVHWATYGILVNAIGPAYFPSAMTSDLLEMPELVAEIERRTPLGRIGRSEELKGPVVFLASGASSYITGQTLFVDGGWTAW